jgi:peptidyl-prolyl cis-trans isomerase SurA
MYPYDLIPQLRPFRARCAVPWLGFLLPGLLMLHGSVLLAQRSMPPVATAEREIAARVGPRTIYADQVERELRRVLRGRPIEDAAEAKLRTETLQLLIDRQKILAWLESKGQAATKTDLDRAVQQRETEVAKRGGTWEQYLRDLDLVDTEDLRGALRWQLSWRRFLDQYLTDENLERYFREHRRDFDGTRLRVAHIRIPARDDQPESWPAAEKQATDVLRQIRSGMKTFDQAAREASVAPTAAQGGELGWIERHRPMVESFSQAAFTLQPGQISEPVVTPFGVHVIHCLEVEPGQRSWRDARSELETAVSTFLFRWAAQRTTSP